MRVSSFALTFSALFLVAACGGGGGGGGAPPGLDAGVSLNGPWRITSTTTAVSGSDTSLCDPVGTVDTTDITIAQTGNQLTITETGEPTRSGSLSGRQLVLTRSFTEAGIRASETVTLNFVANGTSFGGSGTVTYTTASSGAVLCRESFTITAVRGPGGGTPINVVGMFTGTETVSASSGGAPCDPVGPATADDWTLTQTGTSVTWDAGDPDVELTGTLTGTSFSGTKTGTVSGSSFTLVRNVTFAADGSSFSGTDVVTVTGAMSCTQTDQITGTRGTGGTPINVVGMFTGTETVSASSGGAPCQPVGPATADDWTLTQTGTSVTWDAGDPDVELTGTLTGTSFSGTKTGTLSGSPFTLVRNVTFAADGSSFSGTDVVTVTGAMSCTQTDQITGTRGTGGTPINVVGMFTGTETVSASSGGAPCQPVGPATADDWTLTQTGTSVTWDAGDPDDELTGTLTGTSFSGTKTGTVSGSPFTLVRNVTFAADGSSFSGTDVVTVTGAMSCTQTDQITGTRGTGGGTSLTVKLDWPAGADLDLFLQESGGATVGYNAPSTTGGVFSGDTGCPAPTAPYSEQWMYATPVAGSWIAKPRFFQFCSPSTGPVMFTLTITKPGASPSITTGTFPVGAMNGAEMPTPFSF